MAERQTSADTNNINYLSHDYSTTVEYFDKRLTMAKESNDQIGQRRAHENLGNTYLSLENFDKALYHYKQALHIGELLHDGLFTAQINFIIGRIYNLKQEYETSIYFHEKHLTLARQFQDSKGQCRAYFILSQLYETINQYDKAKKYLNLYKTCSKEVDESNEGKSGSKNNNFLKNLRAESICISLSESYIPHSSRSNSVINSINEKSIGNTNKKPKLNFMQHLTKKSPLIIRKQSSTTDPDDLVDIVCRMQKSRFDDQRCDIKIINQQSIEKNTSNVQRTDSQLDDILNTVDRFQQLRMNDQRTTFPSSTNHNDNTTRNQRLSPLNEQFLDQLAKCQDSRMNDQRAVLLPLPNTNNTSSPRRPMSASSSIIATSNEPSSSSSSKTLPDEDFFSLLNRLESRHLKS